MDELKQNYTKRAVDGLIIILIILVLTGISAYFLRIILARSLSVEEYGLFFGLYSLISLFSSIRDFGFLEAITKFIAEFKAKGKNELLKASIVYVAFITIGLSFLILIIIVLFSKIISNKYAHDSSANLIVIAIAISFFIYGGELLLRHLFQGFQKMSYFSSISLVKTVLLLVFSVIFINLGFGLMGVSISYILAPLVVILIYAFLFIRYTFPDFFKIKMQFNKELMKKMVYFAIPATLSQGASALICYTDNIVLTFSSTIKYVGIYNVALPTAMLINQLFSPLRFVLYPMASELWAKNEITQLNKGLQIIYKYSFMIILPILVIIITYSELIINILFGPKYIEANMALKILSIGMFLLSLSQINIILLGAAGMPKINMKTTFISAVINLILNVLLIPYYGIIGAAIATTISFACMFLLSKYDLKKQMNISPPIKECIKTLLGVLIFWLIIGVINYLLNTNDILKMIVSISIAGAAYLALLLLFKILDLNEIKFIYNRWRGYKSE